CKWSRKGFLRTRWRFGKTVVDFVNIHLFHDSCNLVAASTFPSPFAQHREKTLKYTLDRIQSDSLEKCPLFIFGDFNFRINTNRIMEILKKDYGEPGTDSESPLVFGTKRFQCPDKELRFKHSFEWLKQHDFESKNLCNMLQEHEVNFHPTYPFEEDVNEPEKFLKTRIPAWCDRVLFTPTARDIFAKEFPIDYNLIGSKVCMGDHKPVYLYLKIRTNEHSSNSLNSNQDTTPLNENTIKGNYDDAIRIVELTTPASLLISPKSPTLSTSDTTFADIPPLERAPAKTIAFDYNTIDNPSNSEAQTSCTDSTTTGSGSDSPTECKCFFGLFKRGKLRLSSKGGGASSSGRAFGLAFPSRSLKFKRGGSGSLLEPITAAACDPPCSSLPSSGAPSQRPSIALPKESTETALMQNNDENDAKSVMSSNDLPFFTAPPPSPSNNTKWNAFDKGFCWKCGCPTKPGHNQSSIQTPEIISTPNDNVRCPNRCNLLMLNLTQNYRPKVEPNADNPVDATTNIGNGKLKEVSNPQSKGASIEMPLAANLSLVAINGNVSDKQTLDISEVGGECQLM
ncbi:Type I inositol 1,4,5-trisphosphate 5-phosphatase, partial [Orchesella cincta]